MKKLTSDERRSVIGVLAVAQAIVLVLVITPTVVEHLIVPLCERRGWSIHPPLDVARFVVDVQQWAAWSLWIDFKLFVVVIALGQLLLSAVTVLYVRPRPWALGGLCLAMLALGWTIVRVSARPLFDDRWMDPTLFCAAYLAPAVGNLLIARGLRLAVPAESAFRPARYTFSLRTLLIASFVVALLLSIAANANSATSPRWVDTSSNGLIWGLGAWLGLRAMLSELSIPRAMLLAVVGVAVSVLLLLYSVRAQAPAIMLFGTQWLTVYANSTHSVLGIGLARLIGCNVAFIALTALIVRLCGYRFTTFSTATATGTPAQAVMAVPAGACS